MTSLVTLGALVIWIVCLYAFSQWNNNYNVACETIYKTKTTDDTRALFQDVMNPERYNIDTYTWGGYAS